MQSMLSIALGALMGALVGPWTVDVGDERGAVGAPVAGRAGVIEGVSGSSESWPVRFSAGTSSAKVGAAKLGRASSLTQLSPFRVADSLQAAVESVGQQNGLTAMSRHCLITSSAERCCHTCPSCEDVGTVHTYQQRSLFYMTTGCMKEVASRRLVTEAAIRTLGSVACRHQFQGNEQLCTATHSPVSHSMVRCDLSCLC